MKILAGIVLYNPDMGRLRENIDAIYEQVDHIVFFNNGSVNKDEIHELLGEYTDIAVLDSEVNLGIAPALGRIMVYAKDNDFDWVLSLDQDSVCRPGLIDAYVKYTGIEKVGILTCNIVDRNFNTSSNLADGQEWKEVAQCITSASFMSVSAYGQTDGYDEKLFIDSVDFDICINMRKHGFKIIKINFDGVLHEVGHGKNVKLLFKDYITYNHSPLRQYYMARNHMYLVKKYPDEFSYIKELGREIRSELLIIFYEKNKIKKIRQRWHGLHDVKKLLS